MTIDEKKRELIAEIQATALSLIVQESGGKLNEAGAAPECMIRALEALTERQQGPDKGGKES